MKNVKMFMLVVTVLALAALACSIGGGGGQPSEGVATLIPGGGVGEGGTPPTQETATSALPPAEQDLTLSTLTEGLATLKSYKSAFTIKFVGKDQQGQPVNGSLETREEFTQEPKAQRIAFTSIGLSPEQAAQSGTFEMVTIGDTSYLIMQDQDRKRSCISTSSEATQPQQGLFTPEMLGGISGAKYVNTETVNGIKTKHYTWKEGGGLVGLGFTSVKGDVWVAVDGNYVVKYMAEATGKGTLFFGSSGEEGTITIEYNLTEVNGSFKIESPAECEAVATDIPIMADAKDKATFSEMVSYTSASAFADVVQFYKKEMPNNGWQPSGEPTEMEGLATLEFTKDNRKAQVMISYDQDKQIANVIITTTQE